MNKCIAIAERDRIQLDIRKGDDGYEAFSTVLNLIDNGKCMSWYGDITNADGKETTGLIITVAPKEQGEARQNLEEEPQANTQQPQ